MIFGLLRKINTAQPVRQGGLWDVYGMGRMGRMGRRGGGMGLGAASSGKPPLFVVVYLMWLSLWSFLICSV